MAWAVTQSVQGKQDEQDDLALKNYLSDKRRNIGNAWLPGGCTVPTKAKRLQTDRIADESVTFYNEGC